MRVAVVVEGNPVTDDAHGMPDGLEAVTMRALLLQGPDEALDHPVLLRAVRRDELLLEPVAADNFREVVAGEDEAIVRTQKELFRDCPEFCAPAW